MSKLSEEYRNELAEAKRRITITRIGKDEREADQAKPFVDRTIPGAIGSKYCRGGYRVAVDGHQVAWLFYKGGWGRGRWQVEALDYSANDYATRIEKRRGVHGKTPVDLSFWLRHDYSPETFPTAAAVALRKAEAVEAEARCQREREQRRQERDAAERRRKEAAETALDGLREIEGLALSNYQRHALAFAIEEVRRIAGKE